VRRYPADELPELELPACGQWWVLVGAGVGELVEADADDPGDELADVVCATVVPVAAVPPADASATPVAPAPAATMPAMSSRQARPLSLEVIWFLPSWRPRVGSPLRDTRLRNGAGCGRKPRSQRTLILRAPGRLRIG